MKNRKLRIHGDNIVECERTLKMIAEAYNTTYVLLSSPIFCPKYTLKTANDNFEIELLSGHGRWSGIDLGSIVHKSGGKLRESADSYITEIVGQTENVILAIEYCSALPAGNNAWQRNGRALASVFANIPYLYYAEIGGIELDDNRIPKAPRYPNPAVPFSYITISEDMNSVCLPVYREHPSMTTDNAKTYMNSFGYNDGLEFIKKTIDHQNTKIVTKRLTDKALSLVETLSNSRRTTDTLRNTQWKNLLISSNRPHWLSSFNGFPWRKKSSSKVLVTKTLRDLISKTEAIGAKPITAKDLPMCIIPKDKTEILKRWINNTYSGINATINTDKDLAIVWITGFKPRGDDSRPDRGLAPFCRMILGFEANIMAVVYGPGTNNTWNLLRRDPQSLCNSNGLFQSIYTCCNYLLVDSSTCSSPFFSLTNTFWKPNNCKVSFNYIKNLNVHYFEQDTDCAIHQILSHHENLNIFECFCNPPGGDWSGITFFKGPVEYKWTSLPRVSPTSKRPDHIFQINKGNDLYFIPIESKGNGRDLEINVGLRLKSYINDIFQNQPTAYKNKSIHPAKWGYYNGNIGKINYNQISVGAFIYKNALDLTVQLNRCQLDAVFGFEFGNVSILHFYCNNGNKGNILLAYLRTIASKQKTFVIKVH